MVIPVFKDKGRDPLLMKIMGHHTYFSIHKNIRDCSYTVNKACVGRSQYSTDQPNYGHVRIYRSDVPCRYSIFSEQEAERKFTDEGDIMYTCFFDMAFLFDTVEFFVLLEQLLSKLESFQSEVRKHILQLLKYTSNNISSNSEVAFSQYHTSLNKLMVCAMVSQLLTSF